MKKLFFTLFILASVFSTSLSAYVQVDGYYRSNGTYVKPHIRTNPDQYKYNNFSYDGY